MQYNTKQVIEMLKNYKKDRETLERLTAEFDNNLTTGEGVAQYGTNAAMPKSNKISDPTFHRAKQLLYSNNVIENMENRIKFIDESQNKLIKDNHIIVFVLRREGHTCDYIKNVLQVSRTRVHGILNEIAQVLCKDDDEYNDYKKKVCKEK
ncbi:hypothetical protein [Staphylococcus felis]|uniref:hypothetical protein n=1 Tax=Staphylococcus felis TaxID=46127 RepID=UPI003966E768